MFSHLWLGSEATYLDMPHLTTCGDMVIGCYGGNRSAGANKNEDGVYTLCADDQSWHFAALCDAHVTNESAAFVLRRLAANQESLIGALSQPIPNAFSTLHNLILGLLSADDFRALCQHMQGETACLMCAQKEQWLWWLSIGDCSLYLFHPELAHLGQFALNQRNFYEWVGKVNTFDLAIPCFTSGVRELRHGWNCILMTTDGLLEFGTHPFEDSRLLYSLLMGNETRGETDAEEGIKKALVRVHEEHGRDSATIIQWGYESLLPGVSPSG